MCLISFVTFFWSGNIVKKAFILSGIISDSDDGNEDGNVDSDTGFVTKRFVQILGHK